MIQQVNLYQDSGTSLRPTLPGPYRLAAIGAALCLSIISGFGLFQRHQHSAELQTLKAQLRQAQARVETLRAHSPNPQTDLTLLQELQQTQALQQSLSEILELLADHQSDQSRGFSRYFAALAEQTDGNAWITGIRIDNETDDFTLRGSAFMAEQIPMLLRRLQNSATFGGRHFARLDIQQSKQFPEQVDFSVSSKLEPEKEMADARKP